MIFVKSHIKKSLLPVVFFIAGICFGQNWTKEITYKTLEADMFSGEKSELENIENGFPSNSYYYGKIIYFKGVIQLKQEDSIDKGLTNLRQSLDIFKRIDSLYALANVNFQLYDLLSQYEGIDDDYLKHGTDFITYALSKKNTSSLLRARAHLIKADISWENVKETTNHYKNALKELKKKPYPIKIAAIQMNIGALYKDRTSEMDSACHYYATSLRLFQEKDFKPFIAINYNNQAKVYENLGDYEMAAKFLQKSNNADDVSDYNINTRATIYRNKIAVFEKLKRKDSITKYLKLLHAVRDTIDKKSQQDAIIKYQTLEKEKNLEIEREKNKKNQNIAFALGGSLILGAIIAILVYRNTKRKQHIAEQAQELEIRKTEKILKEKEIETINAMVSGQEKERHRLAGELHDNLGSTLATVRMQVENLERNLDKVDNPKTLLSKTHMLINEAYEKVRRISHERNAGVLAKDGLLPAVQRLAKTISSDDGLSIEVEDFGLEQRLSNDLEITIFRVVQELVTNIIKHARATEATISLTQHENELNILIEDNGKGFKVGTLQTKDGMGLGSIERRIEHLEGSMSVDSTPGRGTHIIIDIPL